MPLGAQGLTASASAAYLESRPRGIPVTGRAKQAAFTLSYPLVRAFRRSADLSLGVDALNSDNAAFGNVIASERTRAIRGVGSIVDVQPRRELPASLAVSRGLEGLGARVGVTGARTGFVKVSGGAAVSQAVGKRLVARLSATGQWSPHAVPAAERLAMGGDAVGRAFDTAVLAGDRGIAGLAELG